MDNSLIYKFSPLQPAVQDHTAYWDGAFTEEELKKIESLDEWLKTEQALVGSFSLEVNLEKRQSEICWLPLREDTKFIWDKIADVVMKLNNQFFHFDLDGFYEQIQLSIYDEKENGHYGWHTDAGAYGIPRKLSFSMLLTDPKEFEGGEFQIMTTTEVPITMNQSRGRAWVFPSNYLHRVTPVTKGTRKSLVIWAGGPAFK